MLLVKMKLILGRGLRQMVRMIRVRERVRARIKRVEIVVKPGPATSMV